MLGGILTALTNKVLPYPQVLARFFGLASTFHPNCQKTLIEVVPRNPLSTEALFLPLSVLATSWRSFERAARHGAFIEFRSSVNFQQTAGLRLTCLLVSLLSERLPNERRHQNLLCYSSVGSPHPFPANAMFGGASKEPHNKGLYRSPNVLLKGVLHPGSLPIERQNLFSGHSFDSGE
jgi:hypothetical protein